MKKILLTTAVAAVVLGLTLINGCKKEETPGGGSGGTVVSSGVSAEKTSFKEVTSKLDAGGNLYVYMDTAHFVSGLSGKISSWRELFSGVPGPDRENVMKAFDLLTRVVKDSGIEDVSGFGVSSIAREGGLYHVKSVLHHYKGQGDGFGWKMFGDKPHALAGLDLLPANTAMAVFSDANVPLLWSVIEKEGGQSGFPQVEGFLRMVPGQYEQATGLKWDDTLHSLGGEYGIVLTLDESQMIPLPIPGTQLEIPAPGLMLVAKVNDDTIFNRIDSELKKNAGQQVISVDKSDLKMRTIPVPLPMPIELRPTIAMSGGYLFVASSDAMVQEALAVKAGQKPGLKSTDEFKRLSADVPQEGNEFCYLSQRFGRTLMQVQQSALDSNAHSEPAVRKFFATFLSPDRAAMSYSVTANTDEGWYSVGNGNQNPSGAILASTLIVPGMLAAIAVPNFVKARETAQRNACINNLRQIDAAKQQWALENNKKADDVPAWTDLMPYIGRPGMMAQPHCPKSGHYTIGAVGQPPTCSIPDHSLPNY